MPSAPIDPETIADPDAPEIAERDWALARRADGAPVDPVAYLRTRLDEALSDLDRTQGDDRKKVETAMSRMREMLRELDKAG